MVAPWTSQSSNCKPSPAPTGSPVLPVDFGCVQGLLPLGPARKTSKGSQPGHFLMRRLNPLRYLWDGPGQCDWAPHFISKAEPGGQYRGNEFQPLASENCCIWIKQSRRNVVLFKTCFQSDLQSFTHRWTG